jgi:hypothetical protein
VPEIKGRTLVMVIQAVEAEIRRLRALPDEDTVPGDELLLVDYENVAEDLKELYDEATITEPTLPAYEQLLGRR